MPFLSPLDMESIRRTNSYKLTAPLIYFSPSLYYTIQVPTGFETDLASVPKHLQGAISASAGYIRDAAVVHDFLYVTQPCTRAQADKVLYEAMLELGSEKSNAYIAWIGVRAFGWIYWNKHKRTK